MGAISATIAASAPTMSRAIFMRKRLTKPDCHSERSEESTAANTILISHAWILRGAHNYRKWMWHGSIQPLRGYRGREALLGIFDLKLARRPREQGEAADGERALRRRELCEQRRHPAEVEDRRR